MGDSSRDVDLSEELINQEYVECRSEALAGLDIESDFDFVFYFDGAATHFNRDNAVIALKN